MARLAIAAPLLLVAACGSSETRVARHTTAERTAAVDISPEGVALPTCLQPEIRPVSWALYCGDGAYSMSDLVWSWSPSRAKVRTSILVPVSVAAGPGRLYPADVVFDRPRKVPELNGRYLFSRLTVTYLHGRGPMGKAVDQWDLTDYIADEVSALQNPVTPPPCVDDQGVNSCAPDLGDPYEEPTPSPS